jgi:hypothetical protein
MKRWLVVYSSPVSRTDKTRLDGRDATTMDADGNREQHAHFSPRRVVDRLVGLSVSATEMSRRTNFEACPRRSLTQGGVRTVGAQEMDFTGLNETAIWVVFSP